MEKMKEIIKEMLQENSRKTEQTYTDVRTCLDTIEGRIEKGTDTKNIAKWVTVKAKEIEKKLVTIETLAEEKRNLELILKSEEK